MTRARLLNTATRCVALVLSFAPAFALAADCRPLPRGQLGSAARDFQRIEQLEAGAAGESLLFRRASDDVAGAVAECGDGMWLAPLDARAAFLGGYPDDRNDGLLWSGRGVSSALTGGVVARWKFLSAGVLPAVGWTQNRDYARRLAGAPGLSPDAHPFLGAAIDLPSRMGSGAYTVLDAGQSFVRADLGPFAAGFSTENLWWGPGLRDALVLTNSAPGFPHVFAGTHEPLDVRIGHLEAHLALGRLTTSEYLAADGRVDHTVIRTAAISFEPAFARGLFVGFAHATIGVEEGTVVESAARHLVSAGSGHPDGSQNSLSAIFGRWVIPAARLELFGEWGRDDTAKLLEFAMDPGRSSAYSLGLQKLFTVRGRTARLHLEHVDTFETPAVNAPLGVPVFYTHDFGTFYTHRGQSLGAGVGPAATAQFAALDLLGVRSRIGVYAERRLRNMRAFYDSFARLEGRDMELGGGVRQVVSRGRFELEWQGGLARRWNADFLGNEWQPRFQAAVTWWP